MDAVISKKTTIDERTMLEYNNANMEENWDSSIIGG